MSLSLLVVTSMFAVSHPPARQATDPPAEEALAAAIDAWLEPLVESGELSGTLLVARGGDVLYEKSCGYANVELSVPNTPETRHCVASITKPMTVAIGARLLEAGAIGLADPLADWIEGFPNGDRITIDHLLNHRAGIPHRVTTPEQQTVPRTAAEMVEFAREAELLGEPGEKEVYSSAGYSVLARVLELAGGAPYEELLQEFVCEPAGMRSTTHADSRAIVPGRARGYVPGMGGDRCAPLQDYSFLVGAGSVYSTARDLHRFQRAVLDGKYGPTVRAALIRDDGMKWNGATDGFRAFADHDLESDVSVILVANRASGANDLVRSGIPAVVAGESIGLPKVPDVTPVAVDPDVLLRYEGSYELGPGESLEVVARDGALFMEDWILVPTGEGSFFSPQDYGVIESVLDDEGRVVALSWGGLEMLKRAD